MTQGGYPPLLDLQVPMTALFALATVCWLWVHIATPRRPLPGSVCDALVCDRLRAHQRGLVTLAACISMLAFLALVLDRPTAPDHVAAAQHPVHAYRRAAAMPDMRGSRGCFATWLVAPVCWRLQPDGSWAMEGQLDDGTWAMGTPLEDGTWSVVGLVVMPAAYPSAAEAWEGDDA